MLFAAQGVTRRKDPITQLTQNMASIPVSLDGFLYDLLNRTTQRVLILADASLQGLSIGGGPIQPPPGGGTQPPGGGYPPHPAFPIYGPGIPTQPVDPGWGVGGPGKPPEGGGGGGGFPPKPGDAQPPPGAPPKPTAPPPPDGTWYWQGLWQMWVWVPSTPPPTGGTTPPSTDVGPAHPIAPTVPEPKSGP
jgi:hypothetical protein